MAEFCPECLCKIMGEKYTKHKYILSDDLERCEECGKLKRVVIVSRKAYYYNKFKCILAPIQLICLLIIYPFIFPYYLYLKRKAKRNK